MNLLLQTFSRREAQIFDLVCQGLTNNEIADKLFLSQRTVEVHRSHITKKLGSHTPISVLYELARCSGNSIDLLTSKRRKPVPQPPTFARASVQVVTPLQGNKGTLTYPIPTGGSISIVPPRGNDKNNLCLLLLLLEKVSSYTHWAILRTTHTAEVRLLRPFPW